MTLAAAVVAGALQQRPPLQRWKQMVLKHLLRQTPLWNRLAAPWMLECVMVAAARTLQRQAVKEPPVVLWRQ